MSVMVGIGRGAQMGVLIRNAEAIENLAKLDTLAVDKTGTLTEGKPKLAQVLPVRGVDEKEVHRLTASLEQGSEHPLAHAVVVAARDQQLQLERPGASRLALHAFGAGQSYAVSGEHRPRHGHPLRYRGLLRQSNAHFHRDLCLSRR